MAERATLLVPNARPLAGAPDAAGRRPAKSEIGLSPDGVGAVGRPPLPPAGPSRSEAVSPTATGATPSAMARPIDASFDAAIGVAARPWTGTPPFGAGVGGRPPPLPRPAARAGSERGATPSAAIGRATRATAPAGPPVRPGSRPGTIVPAPAPTPAPDDDWRRAGFGLYLHWPFCQSKCPYCDFNSHVAGAVDEARWARAFEAEIARVAAETGPRALSSVFLGGGTPSLMSPELVASVLGAARAAWPMGEDVEVTLEANPTSVEAGRFRGYRDAGVNRVSLGVQALDDADLRRLGRRHDLAQALAAIEVARATFERVSFDLIYARQHQSAAAWRAELVRALAMGPDHLSLYQLTIEDGTAFGARLAAGRLPGLPDEDAGAELYEITQDMCDAAGLPAYEVSNHARPGAASRHNLIYWRGGDWAGVGPGAHGRLTLDGRRWASEAEPRPDTWLAAVEAGSGDRPRRRGSSRRARRRAADDGAEAARRGVAGPLRGRRRGAAAGRAAGRRDGARADLDRGRPAAGDRSRAAGSRRPAARAADGLTPPGPHQRWRSSWASRAHMSLSCAVSP